MDKIIYERWGHVHVARRSGLGFAAHMHDEIELIYIRKGPITAYVDGTEYILNDNSLLIIFPNQLHSYSDGFRAIDSVNYIMIFKSDILRAFSRDFDGCIPENPVISDKEALKNVNRYLDEALNIRAQEKPFSIQGINACATLILSEILPLMTFKKAKTLQNDTSADIFAYCNKNFKEDISLESMSKELNISKEHIMRLFRERFHTTFRAYVNRLRIDKAKDLLKTTDKTITDISMLVGYNTIRTFNRAFVSITGTSPTEYRSK